MNTSSSIKSAYNSIKPSDISNRTSNPIRNLFESITSSERQNPEQKVISLSLGDPSQYKNFQPHPSIQDALIKSVHNKEVNGYTSSMGNPNARKAIAAYSSTDSLKYKTEDIFIASGCSEALKLAIGSICTPGDCILLPAPGFPLYLTLSKYYNIETIYYKCLVNCIILFLARKKLGY